MEGKLNGKFAKINSPYLKNKRGLLSGLTDWHWIYTL